MEVLKEKVSDDEMIPPEGLEHGCWYKGIGRGARYVRWNENSMDDGLFFSLRYHWWGGRDWPDNNGTGHGHWEHGGDFRPASKVVHITDGSVDKAEVTPLSFLDNGDHIGRWFPDGSGGHVTIIEFNSSIDHVGLSFDEFDPTHITHKQDPDSLSLSAQQKIKEHGLLDDKEGEYFE